MSVSSLLITGGAGFVGSALALRYKQAHPDCRVIALDNLKRRGSELNLPRRQGGGVVFLHRGLRHKQDFAALPPVEAIFDA